MKFDRRALFALAAAALLLTGCGGGDAGTPATGAGTAESAAPKKLRKLVLQTDWYPQPEHGGFYHAVAHGFYQDAGFDVEIRPGANLSNLQQIVATGRVDFAVGTSDTMAIAVGRGLPLVGVYPYFQHDPQCLLLHENSPVRTIADLEGHEVMAQPSLGYIEYIQRSLGIKLKLLPMNYSLARFMGDENFIQQCFLTSEPYFVEQQGVKARTISLSESGYDPYRHIYTTKKMVTEEPEVVQAFVTATHRGWVEYIEGNGRDETNAMIMAANNQQTPEFIAWTVEAMKRHSLVAGNSDNGDVQGRFRMDRIETQLAQLAELDLLDRPVKAEDSFTLQFLPGSND